MLASDGLPLAVDVNVYMYKGLMELGLVALARGGTMQKGYVRWPQVGCMENATPSAAEVQVQVEAQLRKADAPAQAVEEISLRSRDRRCGQATLSGRRTRCWATTRGL